MWKVQSLYDLAIQTMVESDHFNPSCVVRLPGLVKEDILNIALLRSKIKMKISVFLHDNMIVLNTRGYTISDEDLVNIGKCHQIRALLMNPPVTMRFDHPSSLMNEMLSKLQYLVKLHLQRNDGVTDNVMKTMVSHLHRLQELDVSGCQKLTDSGAESLSMLSELRILNISETQISDEGVVCIAKGKCALSLTELWVNNCENIRGQSFKYIIQNCKYLRILALNGYTHQLELVVLKHLNINASTAFFRMCCNLPPSNLGPCHHFGNTVLKLRHTGLLVIM